MAKDIYVFPYGITLSRDGQLSVFPAAEVALNSSDNNQITLFFLVDSGATISSLPKHDAELLGIDAENGYPIEVSGIDGKTVNGWRHEVPIILGEESYLIPIVFLDGNTPRVLGREGIFNRFNIIFDEKRKRTTFVKVKSEEEQSINKIIDLYALD